MCLVKKLMLLYGLTWFLFAPSLQAANLQVFSKVRSKVSEVLSSSAQKVVAGVGAGIIFCSSVFCVMVREGEATPDNWDVRDKMELVSQDDIHREFAELLSYLAVDLPEGNFAVMQSILQHWDQSLGEQQAQHLRVTLESLYNFYFIPYNERGNTPQVLENLQAKLQQEVLSLELPEIAAGINAALATVGLWDNATDEEELLLSIYGSIHMPLSIVADVEAGKVVSLAQSQSEGGYDAALNLHDQLVLAALDNGHAATARAMVMYRPHMLNERLFGAVLDNDAQRVKETVARGATDLNTALRLAAYNQKIELVRFLVGAGANDYIDALDAAFDAESDEIIDFLIALDGMDVNVGMRVAVANESLKRVQQFIALGANDFDTPLQHIAQDHYPHHNSWEVVKLLIAKATDLNTPLLALVETQAAVRGEFTIYVANFISELVKNGAYDLLGAEAALKRGMDMLHFQKIHDISSRYDEQEAAQVEILAAAEVNRSKRQKLKKRLRDIFTLVAFVEQNNPELEPE